MPVRLDSLQELAEPAYRLDGVPGDRPDARRAARTNGPDFGASGGGWYARRAIRTAARGPRAGNRHRSRPRRSSGAWEHMRSMSRQHDAADRLRKLGPMASMRCWPWAAAGLERCLDLMRTAAAGGFSGWDRASTSAPPDPSTPALRHERSRPAVMPAIPDRRPGFATAITAMKGWADSREPILATPVSRTPTRSLSRPCLPLISRPRPTSQEGENHCRRTARDPSMRQSRFEAAVGYRRGSRAAATRKDHVAKR